MFSFLKSLAKDIFFSFSAQPLGERASILSYHDIGTSKAFFTVSSRAFEKQIAYLAQSGNSIVRLSELVERLHAHNGVAGCVALTFNDGYESVYTTAFPLLKKHAVPASVFVSVEYLDTSIQTSDGFTFKTLSLAQMREMLESGLVEFFPETQHRVPLDSVAFEGAAMKIDQARADLESVIKKDAKILSFPKGRYTQKILDYLKEGGWLGAVTTQEGLVHAGSSPFALPRNSIDSKTSFTQFKGKLSGAIDAYVHTKK